MEKKKKKKKKKKTEGNRWGGPLEQTRGDQPKNWRATSQGPQTAFFLKKKNLDFNGDVSELLCRCGPRHVVGAFRRGRAYRLVGRSWVVFSARAGLPFYGIRSTCPPTSQCFSESAAARDRDLLWHSRGGTVRRPQECGTHKRFNIQVRERCRKVKTVPARAGHWFLVVSLVFFLFPSRTLQTSDWTRSWKATTHYTLHTKHLSLYTIHYTLYTIHYTLYTIHCTLYTIHCTAPLYNINFTFTLHYNT